MLCQKCHKKTASVFISSIINGQETRMYLCSDCAKDYPLFVLIVTLHMPNIEKQESLAVVNVMKLLKSSLNQFLKISMDMMNI